MLWQTINDVPSDLPLLVGDKARLMQVFSSLLSNCAKFTAQGVVHVTASQKEGNICVDVSDTGCGIPAENIATIFEQFSQVTHASPKPSTLNPKP